jgi:methylenetetrahydrofolate--tRNA-(uracil-5-)-methyltransferase
MGALAYYVSHADPAHYEPSNITFGIMAPLPRPPKGGRERRLAMAERAISDLNAWAVDHLPRLRAHAPAVLE